MPDYKEQQRVLEALDDLRLVMAATRGLFNPDRLARIYQILLTECYVKRDWPTPEPGEIHDSPVVSGGVCPACGYITNWGLLCPNDGNTLQRLGKVRPEPAPVAVQGVELPPLDEECIGLERTRDPLQCRERQLLAALAEIDRLKREDKIQVPFEDSMS